jgi:hypothetical protein
MSKYEPQFLKASEQGRPTQRENLPILFSNFSLGTDQHNPTPNATGGIARIINGRCTRATTLDRRQGKVVMGDDGDAGQVYMLASLQVSDGDDIFLRLVEGAGAGVQLQKYDSVDDEWDDLGTNIGDADSRVDWFSTSVRIAGEDRLYFTNGVDDLRYTNGTAVTTVTGVVGKYITHVGDILVLGHLDGDFGPHQVIYAQANTHTFYSNDDGSYAASTQTFTFPGEVTQLRSFNSLVYVFTKADGLWEIDLNDDSYRQISTHGTMSPKSVAIDWDVMIWADQDGIWALPINGDVLKVSTTVDNIYSQVTVANIFQMVGGFNTNGQYELHLGALTYEGTEYLKYCLVYEIEQSREIGQNTWKEDNGKEFANCMAKWTNAYGFTQSYYGSRTNQTVYINDYGYADGADVDIELVMETADIQLTREKEEAMLEDIYITYEPNGTETIPLSLYVRADTGTWTLQKTVDLPAGSTSMSTVRIQASKAMKGRSFAFKIVSEDDKSFRLYEIFATYGVTNNEIPST